MTWIAGHDADRGEAAWPAFLPAVSIGAGAVDVIEAVAFVEQEACLLRTALARPSEQAAEVVLAAQDRAHASWLALVSGVSRGGDPGLAEELTRLYGFHGRLAGWLERGADPLLGGTVVPLLRLLLVDELRGKTGGAVQGLIGLARVSLSAEPS